MDSVFTLDEAGLDYCGYIGGHDSDRAMDVAVDGSGHAYVIGDTSSTQSDATYPFPVTVGPDTTHNNYRDAFVAKVNPSGTVLRYCGYIGGSEGEFSNQGHAVAVDSVGNAYIAGLTSSDETRFVRAEKRVAHDHRSW